MGKHRRRLPIGVQGFESLRSEGFLYVDKTRYIYDLAHGSKQYFLSRPLRFGKSLFLSALRVYWEGKRELFEGLEIAELERGNEDAWQAYPVFYFDFNGKNYRSGTALEDVLDKMLRAWEATYGSNEGLPLEERFQNLLVTASRKYGRKCVVLVDEYDKPLLEVLENDALEEHNKAVFKGFFSTLKSYDEYLKFVFITGVTKFSKVSILSDLNQLNDISLSPGYACICGFTEAELSSNFAAEIHSMAKGLGLREEDCMAELRKMYDGYRFSPTGQGVYNPFSLLKAFFDGRMDAYWFTTGTPTFLVRRMRKMHFDIRQIDGQALYADAGSLSDYRADNPDIVPLLYQTGYLTIVGSEPGTGLYRLGFPNEEVRQGFTKSLFPEYVEGAVPGSGKDIFTLRRYLEQGDTDSIRDVLAALFASIPYTANDAPFEHYFQTVLYLVFTLLGQYTACEIHSSKGRADCIVETGRFVYIFELKVDQSAKAALAQIEEKGYAEPYAADRRRLLKIGAGFNSKSRSLADWEVSEESNGQPIPSNLDEPH